MPFVESFLTGALSGLFVKVAAAVYGRVAADKPPEIDVGLHLVETDLLLTDKQLRAIGELLTTPELTSLVQTYVALTLIDCDEDDRSQWLAECKSAFDDFVHLSVEDLDRESGASDAIWNLIRKVAAQVLPHLPTFQKLSPEDQVQLLNGLAKRFAQVPAKRYIRLIRDVIANVDEIFRIRTLCTDICRATELATRELEIQHTQEHHKFRQEQLYVPRELTTLSQSDTVDANRLLAEPLGGLNLVILGHPGAGKSTLATKVIYDLSRRATRDIAPILVRCRDLGPNPSGAVVNHIVESVNALIDLDINRDDVQTLLALGRCFLVFDGVDEITDPATRRQLIGTIERLTCSYPLSPVVCTTRKVGYETARFSQALFVTAELEEFSTTQVEIYVDKWFTLMNRPDTDKHAFLHESREVDEIRRNPLMLSLLCTLYRVRGYIPMNRYDVYRECANLLFTGWDAMRHIPQPADHKRYGNNLLEELASLFFYAQTDGSGVNEYQVRDRVSKYFSETAGVPWSEADDRARSFLNFCATRAWILTSAGVNTRGQRLFTFTHRTFMEFYVAESIVRRSANEDAIFERIVDINEYNPSSMIPDLIIQSYENKSHQGADRILERLLRHSRRRFYRPRHNCIPLCLRTLNSTTVTIQVAATALTQAFRSYSGSGRSPGVIDKSSFISVLQLNGDARDTCKRILAGSLEGSDTADATEHRRLFMQSWAHLWHHGEFRHLQSGWDDITDFIAREYADRVRRGSWTPDPATMSFLVRNEYLPPRNPNDSWDNALAIECYGKIAPGPLLNAVLKELTKQQVVNDEAIINVAAIALWRSPPAINRWGSQPETLVSLWEAQFSHIRALHDSTFVETRALRPPTRIVLMCIALILIDLDLAGAHPLNPALRDLLQGIPIELIYVNRAAVQGVDVHVRHPWLPRIEPLRKDDIAKNTSNLPTWVAAWLEGSVSIVSNDPMPTHIIPDN